MDDEGTTLVVKTYQSFEELQAEEGFKPDNPVSAENYRRISGDYHFDPPIRCCFQKSNGELCAHWHNNGFVAHLRDNTLTVVGNDCARDKFGADSSIKADSAKYLNEKRRQDQLSRLGELLSTKDATIARLAVLRERLRETENSAREIVDRLGQRTRWVLHDLARTGNGRVSVNGIRIRTSKEKDGTVTRERQVVPITVGTLTAISAMRSDAFRTLHDSMTGIYHAYASAEKISQSVKTSELESLSGTIADAQRIERDAAVLMEQVGAFLSGDLLPLCYLSADKIERVTAARIAAKLGKDKAREWLASKDRELIATNNLDRLEI